MSDLKTCTKCHLARPTSDFHKDKSRSDGREVRCRPCRRRVRRREDLGVGNKRCGKCRKVKSEDDFVKNGSRLHSNCKDCKYEGYVGRKEGYRAINATRPISVTTKRCPRCASDKPAEDFHQSRSTKSGLDGHCRACKADGQSKRLYGVPYGWFSTTLEAQGGVCAICVGGAARSRGRFHIDHEHAPGFDKMSDEEKQEFVRGILCGHCNHKLGVIEEGLGLEALRGGCTEWARQAQAYVQAFEEGHRGL